VIYIKNIFLKKGKKSAKCTTYLCNSKTQVIVIYQLYKTLDIKYMAPNYDPIISKVLRTIVFKK